MISRIRHSFYTVGAFVLLFCLTSVSVSAQGNGDTSRERTVVKQQADDKIKSAGATADSPENAPADNVKETARDESSIAKAVPVSYLLPILAPPASLTEGDAAGGDASPSSPPQGSPDKWHFTLAPYLWLAGIKGTVGARGLTTDIDPSVSDILNALNFGFMGTFEARKNRLMLITDLIYLSIEQTKATSGPLFSSLKVNQKTFMLSPVAGYRLASNDTASLDAIVGVRFWHMSTRLEAAPKLLAGRVEESSKNWADVIGGLRGQAHLGRIFSVLGRGDFGGGGADYSYQLFGGVGVDVGKSVTLIVGYRDLYIKYTRGDFLFDGSIRGAILGAALRF
jgi:hypothetical protein